MTIFQRNEIRCWTQTGAADDLGIAINETVENFSKS